MDWSIIRGNVRRPGRFGVKPLKGHESREIKNSQASLIQYFRPVKSIDQSTCPLPCTRPLSFLPESFQGFPSPAPMPTVEFLIAVFVVVTIVVAVFPVAMVTVMFTVFVPFSFFAAIPLTIVPLITVMLVPFAVVSARYGNGELLR